MQATTIPTQIFNGNINPLEKILPGVPSGICISIPFAPVRIENVFNPI